MTNDVQRQFGGKTYFFSIIFNLVAQIAFSFVMVVVMQITQAESVEAVPGYSTWNLAAMAMLQCSFVAAIIFTRPRLTPIPRQGAKQWATQMLFSVICAAVCLTCFLWLGEWFAIFLYSIGYNLTEIEINGAVDIVLAIAVVVIIAPVVEETVFRNALVNDLHDRHGFVGVVLLSGLCFAFMHMNPQQTVHQFFLGCVCAYAFIKTGNIVVPMVVHALNNLAALLLNFITVPLLTPQDGTISVLLTNPALSVPITVLLAAFGVAAIYFSGKLLVKKPFGEWLVKHEENNSRLMQTISFSICALMWIIAFIGSV